MTTPPRRPSTPSSATTKNLTKNVTKNGGGFNPSVGFSLTVPAPSPKGGGGRGDDSGQGGGAAAGGRRGVPGADFMSNDDIRAFCEYIRKDSRNRATERSMDADHLEAVLKTIPDSMGSRSGARARARRVSRWLKKIAAAEKNIQKYAAMTYGTFEREYEANLRSISPGRPKQQHRQPFNWR